MRDNLPVRVRDCECPETPHGTPDPETGLDGDVIFVLPRPSLQLGLASEVDQANALAETFKAAGPGPFTEADHQRLADDMGLRLRGKLLETYIRHGAVGWNFQDETGPIPFDVEEVIADFAIAGPVADFCDEIYGETVTRPLVQRAQKLSGTGRTASTTSPRPTPIRKRRASSSRRASAGSRR